jgi:hypothetical protein
MRFPEEKKVVPIINTADYNDGVDGDSINMANFFRATFILMFGAITGNAVLKLYSGATDGAKTSALAFHYSIGGAAVGSDDSDVLAADTLCAATGLTLTATTYANKMLIVEVEAVAMDTANDENWLTMEISNAASAGVLHAVAILEPRYTRNLSDSALA